ncbi:hypothetical protein F8M41_002462 [Gigaspora margarita]|uniref:Uncharacterized protein n=1 Tax=Gigaspora margarita TaxID=4874 RepID=A0A8H4AYS8_GIGMA|nr:hypothetical protein F8M41_002462 [Gigaspora margarita]
MHRLIIKFGAQLIRISTVKIEYNIHSNNHNTNKVILTALNDLENTFFVKCSNFDENNSESDNNNSEEILDSDNINLNRLNEFEFVEAPDNYI